MFPFCRIKRIILGVFIQLFAASPYLRHTFLNNACILSPAENYVDEKIKTPLYLANY